MSTEVDFRPPIFQSVEVHGQIFLKLAEAAAKEHIPVNVFAERLLGEGLQNLQLSKPRGHGRAGNATRRTIDMPLTQLLGEAILDNLDIQDIEFAESRYPELSADQLEPIISANTPATLEGLETLRYRCQFAAAWHHALGRLELSAEYKRLAEHFAAAKSKKLN